MCVPYCQSTNPSVFEFPLVHHTLSFCILILSLSFFPFKYRDILSQILIIFFLLFFMSPIHLLISLHPTLFKCLQLRVKKASSFCCLLRENVETDCLPWELLVWCLYMCLIACVPQSASCSEKELITHIFLLNKLKEVQRVGEKKTWEREDN